MVCKRGEGEVDPTKKKSSHDGKETLKISGQDIPRSRYFSLLTLQNKIKWLHLQIAPTYPGPMVEHCGLTVSCQVGVIAAYIYHYLVGKSRIDTPLMSSRGNDGRGEFAGLI